MGKDWSERELERLLRQAVDRSVPDVYQAISREPAAPLLNPDGIVPPPMARRRKGLPLALCACVLLALCIGGFGFFHTAAIISIGGGPDLELSVNRFQRVLAASGYSETGEMVLSGLSLRYQRLDDALETVARSMEEQGCLTGEQDIPVAVDGGDWRYNRELLAMTREVLYLLDGGYCSPETIDLVAKSSLMPRGMLLGVVQRMDFTGLDTVVNGLKNASYSPASAPGGDSAIYRLVEDGQLGAKSGKGFYDYSALEPLQTLDLRDRQLLKSIRLAKAFLEEPLGTQREDWDRG